MSERHPDPEVEDAHVPLLRPPSPTALQYVQIRSGADHPSLFQWPGAATAGSRQPADPGVHRFSIGPLRPGHSAVARLDGRSPPPSTVLHPAPISLTGPKYPAMKGCSPTAIGAEGRA